MRAARSCDFNTRCASSLEPDRVSDSPPHYILREGGRIAVVDLKPEGGSQTVKQIVDAGREADVVQADVSNEEQVQWRAVDATIARWVASMCS